MARLSKEEQKAKHLNDLNAIRVKRYRENHSGEYKTFKAEIDIEQYNKIDIELKEQGITKKQFLEDAIDKFLKGE